MARLGAPPRRTLYRLPRIASRAFPFSRAARGGFIFPRPAAHFRQSAVSANLKFTLLARSAPRLFRTARKMRCFHFTPARRAAACFYYYLLLYHKTLRAATVMPPLVPALFSAARAFPPLAAVAAPPSPPVPAARPRSAFSRGARLPTPFSAAPISPFLALCVPPCRPLSCAAVPACPRAPHRADTINIVKRKFFIVIQ